MIEDKKQQRRELLEGIAQALGIIALLMAAVVMCAVLGGCAGTLTDDPLPEVAALAHVAKGSEVLIDGTPYPVTETAGRVTATGAPTDRTLRPAQYPADLFAPAPSLPAEWDAWTTSGQRTSDLGGMLYAGYARAGVLSLTPQLSTVRVSVEADGMEAARCIFDSITIEAAAPINGDLTLAGSAVSPAYAVAHGTCTQKILPDARTHNGTMLSWFDTSAAADMYRDDWTDTPAIFHRYNIHIVTAPLPIRAALKTATLYLTDQADRRHALTVPAAELARLNSRTCGDTVDLVFSVPSWYRTIILSE